MWLDGIHDPAYRRKLRDLGADLPEGVRP